LAYKPVTLIIPAIQAQGALKTAAVDERIKIKVSVLGTDIVDDDNYLGMTKTAKDDIDKNDVAKPPILEKGYAMVYFKNPSFKTYSGNYSSDIRSKESNSQVWDLYFDSDLVNKEAAIQFSNIDTLHYDIFLYEGKNKIKIQNETSIKVSTNDKRKYKVQLVNKATADNELKILDVINYPNPFDPNYQTCKIKFKLSKNASGSVVIYSISGIKVANFDIDPGNSIANENVLEWDGRDYMGQKLANGCYFYMVKLTDENGNSIKYKDKIVINLRLRGRKLCEK
jgi:hypothetical protein